MSALTSTTTRTTTVADEPLCNCGGPLTSPYEVRNDKCLDCERLDERMICVVCEEYVGMAYCDGRPTFCSDSCETEYWACPV